MSWTTVDPVQLSSVGTTRPTPLPERVGAKDMTCSGPSWRRYWLPMRPSATPVLPNRPAAATSFRVAQRAEPEVVTLLDLRARQTRTECGTGKSVSGRIGAGGSGTLHNTQKTKGREQA